MQGAKEIPLDMVMYCINSAVNKFLHEVTSHNEPDIALPCSMFCVANVVVVVVLLLILVRSHKDLLLCALFHDPI